MEVKMNSSPALRGMCFRLFLFFMITVTAGCAKKEASAPYAYQLLEPSPAAEQAPETPQGPQAPSTTAPSAPVTTANVMPNFEWPPPESSAEKVIPDVFLRKPDKDSVLFRDVDHILSSALDRCGYSDCSYYAVPGGFAVVTRIEQINSDGTPKPGDSRWSVKTPPISPFSDFPQYLKVLFKGNPGYYRVIVFIFTPYGFTQGAKGPTREIVESWFSGGFNVLPAEAGEQHYTKAHRCTALIYEFKKTPTQATLIIPGSITGKAHLERSRLWSVLQR
ncbi:MAG: hypothetical protein HGA46_06270 [Chlorobiaceae bacterium]|jgi:hypothetical protein|nr:hypothetical protein [Chlorobiaceae bacterium]